MNFDNILKMKKDEYHKVLKHEDEPTSTAKSLRPRDLTIPSVCL